MKINHGRIFFILSAAMLLIFQTFARAEAQPEGYPATLNHSFIENKGQWHPDVEYAALLPGMNAWITQAGVVYDYYRIDGNNIRGQVVRMNFINSTPEAVESENELPGIHNYFLGDDPAKWSTGAKAFSSSRLLEIYDNIDLKLYFDNEGLRYDIIVHPGGDPADVAINFDGADAIHTSNDGDLVLDTRFGGMDHSKLFAYQKIDGTTKRVECRFSVKSDGSVGFATGDYDRTRPLIIDPLVYSTFVGGQGSDYVNSMALDLDGNGNAFFAGETMAHDYPVTNNVYDRTYNGGGDVFLSKMNSNGTALIFSTYLGGIHEDIATDIKVDASGSVYVTGFTRSTGFPTTTDAYQRTHGGGTYDAFVTKFNRTGDTLKFSTFLGGTGNEGRSNNLVGDKIVSIDIDGSGNAYITGFTSSANFPTTSDAYDRVKNGTYDVFASKISADGQSLLYSTYLGGNESDGIEYPCGIEYISSGEVIIAGATTASDYPTTASGYDRTHNGNADIFITKLNSDASSLVFSTFYGGSQIELGRGLKIDASGNIHIAGATMSSNLPLSSGAPDRSFNNSGEYDGFLARFSSGGQSLLYSTYLGGEGDDVCQDIITDNSGNSYITGYTGSDLFPVTTGAYDRTFNGGLSDAFLTVISSGGSNISYSTYIGGSDIDQGLGVRIDGSGVYLAGYTKSANFPATTGAMDPNYSGQSDLFITKISLELPKSIELISPADNAALQIGSQYEIRWASENIINIKIQYQTGAQTQTITSSYDAMSGIYNWTVPSISGDFRLIISDVSDATMADTATGLRSGSLAITSPAADTEFFYGESATITWTSSNISEVDLDYSLSGSGVWTAIAESLTASSGSFVWPVPDMTADVELRITDAADESFNSTVDIMLNNHSVSITRPNGGERILSGVQYPIEWENTNVSTLKLEYKAESSASWQPIATGVDASTEQYWWQTTGITTGTYRIRATDEDYPDISDISDNTFSIVEAALDLTSPNGGELWDASSQQQIKWTSSNIDYIDISYSTNSGAAWKSIATDFPAYLQNYYDWTVPGEPSGQYLIKIEASDIYGAVDSSNAVFQIRGVDLTSPDGGGKYLVGNVHNITWRSSGVQNLKIMLSTNSGTTWQTIRESYPASAGFLAWTVPATPSSHCKIKLMDTQNSSFNDLSQSEFTITGLMLTSPDGGEDWFAGTTQQIAWSSASTQEIKIEYSTNGGASWITIISNTPASDGSYDWVVPKITSDNCFVRISDATDSGVYDMNSTPFTITGEGIIITQPTTSTIWDRLTTKLIKWTSINVINLDIEFSSDNGNNWSSVASSVAATAGQYSWTLPDVSSTECLVRVVDSDNPSIADTTAAFRIKGGVYRVPATWEFASRTGSSAIIIVPDSIDPLVGTRDILTGDAIGLFYNRGGELVCGGYGVWTEDENLAITVWGDNGRTSLKDGFAVNENYIYKVWDGQLGAESFAHVKYASGHRYFTNDGISILRELVTHLTQDITLQGSVWSYISSNLLPVDSSLVNLMAGVESAMDLMKNDIGEVYYPAENVNNIEFWDIAEGYHIFMRENAVLTMTGLGINPSDYPIGMSASLWYIISYLPSAPMRTETALATLGDNILVVKNSDGEVYYPRYEIDQIHTMNPTEGYKIILVNADTLTYPSATISPRAGRKYTPDQIATGDGEYHYMPGIRGTGNNAVAVFESAELQTGDEIGIFTESGLLIGGGIYEGGRAVVTIWGDNQSTPASEGATNGDRLTIHCWIARKAEERDFTVESLTNVLSGQNQSKELIYSSDGLWIIQGNPGNILSAMETTQSGPAISIAPNPSDGRFTLRIDSPEAGHARLSIRNALGIPVFESEIGIRRGMNAINPQIGRLPAGAYYLNICIGNYSAIEKLVIIN